MSRFKILSRDEMSASQREVADAITSGPRGALKGPFLALIHNPELASRVQQLGEHLRYGTGLAPQLVEIAVLITARRWSCDYEWAAHARIANEAGLPAEVIDALAVGVRPGQLDAKESAIYDFAWQTVWHGKPADDAFDSLAGQFGLASALDVLAVCGYYTMLAFVLNAAGLPLPQGGRPLDPLTKC